MDLSTLFACLGVSVTLYGVVAYLKGIIKNGTKPRMASWVAWCTANTVFAVVAFGEGAYLAAGINGISALTNFIVIAASIKKGVKMRPGDWIDWACLSASVMCVVVTVVSPAKEISALSAMLANITATIPTIRHAWAKPHEETWPLFAANVAAGSLGVIGIIIVSGPHFASIAGPLITALGNTGLVLITVGRGWFVKVEQELERDIHAVEETFTHSTQKGEEI